MNRCTRRRALLLALLLLPLRMPAAHALTLPDALREVAAANPTIASRRHMAEAARRRIAPAGAWSEPMLELGVLNVPGSGRFDMDPMTMKMVGLEQRIPVSGANGLRRRSASAAAAAEGAGVDVAGIEVYAQAWEAYADAYYAGELARSSVEHRGEMDRLVHSARARYASGNGRLEDVLRAEAEQARTFADFAGFEAEAQGARARLAALMGRDGAEMGDSLAPPPATTIPDDPAVLLADLDDSHPRLRELKAQAERYRLAARAARRMRWPDVQLGVSYGIRQSVMGVAQDNMWTATAGFMLPVFAKQNELAEGGEMEAMARAAESDLRAATLELDQQARGLQASARAGRRTVALLADTVLATQRRAVAASWSAYDAGLSDLWRVFEATHALYTEEVALVRARQELERTEARLLGITARGEPFGLQLPGTRRSEP